MYFIYNLLLWLLSPILLPWIFVRSWRGRLPGLKQRFGFFSNQPHRSAQPCLWFHAVSLGEVKSAVPLIEEMKRRVPGLRIVITSSTRTGFSSAHSLLPNDTVLFPPVDLKWVVRRFLRFIQPDAVIVLETELWPNLFREIKRSGARLLLVNGRISDKAFPRYKLSRILWRQVLNFTDIIYSQTSADATRFCDLGADHKKVHVAGNLKFSIRPSITPFVEVLRSAIQHSSAGPILVAGSTMPGEENFLFDAYSELAPQFPGLWLILAPRHPERFAEVIQLARQRGLPLQLRSTWTPSAVPQLPGVLLLDSVGELGAIYQLATVAFVGGTLVPTGGHNILEPAAYGKPIVIGPYMNNFREILQLFLEEKSGGHGIALLQVNAPEKLTPALRQLFENPEEASRLGQAALNRFQKIGSAVAPIADTLEKLLADPGCLFLDGSVKLAPSVPGAGNLTRNFK
ncbi:MAG: hypothetical protein A3F68_08400 [Acidobacteria bacterium RIFCSPLOWO2_12_FULL_54_10]|nr:MAG: hypothetical protein A3F68_08400 [Acidobacteria bacterium RIFCSPLOWO2_12_FULL_54_10]